MANSYCTDYIDAPTLRSEAKHYSTSRCSNRQLGCKIYKNVIICPCTNKVPDDVVGEIILEDGTIAKHTNSNIDYNCEMQPKCIKPSKNASKAIYLGSMPICWGHYITDGLSKLWFFYTDEGKKLISENIPVVITSRFTTVYDIPNAYKSVIKYLGLPFNLEIIDEVSHYETIYCPDNSLFIEGHTRYYTKEYLDIINKITERATEEVTHDINFGKVYLSRTHLESKTSEFGEKDFERAFKKAGFKIVYPERLTFQQQLSIYKNADTIATTEGSIAHNFIFCRPNSNVIIIRKAFYTNDYQYVINDAKSLKVTYIDGHLSVFTNNQPNLGPFYLYVNDNFIRFFKDTYCKTLKNTFCKHKFFNYAKMCICKKDFYERTNHEVPEWYFNKMNEELTNHSRRVRKKLKKIYFKLLSAHREQVS